MLNISSIPSPRVPMVDTGSGLVERVWYRYLLDLFRVGQWSLVPKLVSESRTADTALTADDDLTVSLLAGETYRVHGVAYLSAANATMDMKFDVNYTGTATVGSSFTRTIPAGSTTESVATSAAAIGSTAVTAATSGIARIEFDVILTTTTAGDIQFRWAQNTSDAGALVCLAGSLIEYLVIK